MYSSTVKPGEHQLRSLSKKRTPEGTPSASSRDADQRQDEVKVSKYHIPYYEQSQGGTTTSTSTSTPQKPQDESEQMSPAQSPVESPIDNENRLVQHITSQMPAVSEKESSILTSSSLQHGNGKRQADHGISATHFKDQETSFGQARGQGLGINKRRYSANTKSGPRNGIVSLIQDESTPKRNTRSSHLHVNHQTISSPPQRQPCTTFFSLAKIQRKSPHVYANSIQYPVFAQTQNQPNSSHLYKTPRSMDGEVDEVKRERASKTNQEEYSNSVTQPDSVLEVNKHSLKDSLVIKGSWTTSMSEMSNSATAHSLSHGLDASLANTDPQYVQLSGLEVPLVIALSSHQDLGPASASQTSQDLVKSDLVASAVATNPPSTALERSSTGKSPQCFRYPDLDALPTAIRPVEFSLELSLQSTNLPSLSGSALKVSSVAKDPPNTTSQINRPAAYQNQASQLYRADSSQVDSSSTVHDNVTKIEDMPQVNLQISKDSMLSNYTSVGSLLHQVLRPTNTAIIALRNSADMPQPYVEAFDARYPNRSSLSSLENGIDAAQLSAGSANNGQAISTALQDPPITLRRSTRRAIAGGVSSPSAALLSYNSGQATNSHTLNSPTLTPSYDTQDPALYSYSTTSGFRPVLSTTSSPAVEFGTGLSEYSLPQTYTSYPNSSAWGQNSTSYSYLGTTHHSEPMGFYSNSYPYASPTNYHQSYVPPPIGLPPFVPAYSNAEPYSSPLSSPPVPPVNPIVTPVSELKSMMTPQKPSLIVKLSLRKSTSPKNIPSLGLESVASAPKPKARLVAKTTKRKLPNNESSSEQPKKRQRSRQVSDEFVLPGISKPLEDHEDSDFSTPQKKTKVSRKPTKKSSTSTTKKSTRKSTKKTSAGADETASEAYYERARKVHEGKPEPIGSPIVWADKRSQLCETLWFYRAYQAAAHTIDGVAYGFMCDMEVGIRDKFDEEIVIARIGGGRTKDEKGNMVQSKDQKESSPILAFMRSIERKIPVAVVAGMGNRLSPSKLKHYYSVLDWFHTTDVWCEVVEGYKCWMVRLEKINLDERSWWAAQGTLPLSSSYGHTRTLGQECNECHIISKHIYNVGWTCLQPECGKFFDIGSRFINTSIDYIPAFLYERTRYEGRAPPPLIPRLLPEKLSQAERIGIEAIPKNGFVCVSCGCCSRQHDWSSWTCENPLCGHIHNFTREILSVSSAITDGLNSKLPSQDSDVVRGGVRVSKLIKGPYDVYDYTIPGEEGEAIGFVRLFKASNLINQQPDGPNDLFLSMQQPELGLRRNPARQSGGVGEILTNHFSTNWGAPYKFRVKQVSKTFADAPDVILKSLMRMTWAGQQTLGNQDIPFKDFNEVLSLGYMEKNLINYHDDGEKTLGPTVATLSLGCSATMKFRPKAKSSINGPPLKGDKYKPDALRIKLEHGDIVIMHGELIQKYYEHAVTPHGRLRFALTSRYIIPERMENEAERVNAKAAGTIPSDFTYTYDGDINAKLVPAPTVPPMDELSNTIRAKLKVGELSSEMAVSGLQQLLMELSSPGPSDIGAENVATIENATNHSVVESRANETTMKTSDVEASA